MSGKTALALEACLARGVREFVVCAGARNACLVLAAARSGAKVWTHFEERSAGFFALGRVRDTARPVAVVTTSGTAVAELLPAVIEAHYQERPLIVISADRPKRFRGSGAPQAIEQSGLFGVYVDGGDDLEDESDEPLFEGWSGLRPWHLNVCLEENEEVPSVKLPDALPEPARRPRVAVTDLVGFLGHDCFRGVVVLLGGLEPEEREEAFHFLQQLAVPVIAEATSGLREALGKLALTDGDRLLREHAPGKILRLGDVPAGRFWRDLEDKPEIEVLSVSRTGFSGLARDSVMITGNVHEVLKGLGEAPLIGDVLDLFPASARRRGLLEELLERYPDSEPGLVRLLSAYAATGESVFLGNSLPVREWNLFAQVGSPVSEVQASRGANGIDGQLSAWLCGSAEQNNAWGVFGDLTALYDLVAPSWLSQVRGRGRILVVINNGGGRIFERLPGLRDLNEDERRLMANAHQHGFEDWARLWDLDYLLVTERDGFEVEPRERPLVLELRPSKEQTADFWKNWER